MSTDQPAPELPAPNDDAPAKKPPSPIVKLFLRGLAITLPPVLTLVILIWIFSAIYDYVIHPVSQAVQYTIAQFVREDVRKTDDLVRWEHQPDQQYINRGYLMEESLRDKLATARKSAEDADSAEIAVRDLIDNSRGQIYVPLGDRAVPYDDYSIVAQQYPVDQRPTTAVGTYMEFVTLRYFPSLFHLSLLAVILTAVLLWFIGGLVTARLGKWFVTKFESSVVGRLPVVSNVYSSVKQVTDFFFTERTVSYNRVVAVEYPRRGMWSIGFVTGDSMLEITSHTGEPMLAILMPTSPMPMTGFTISVPRSQVIDLNISIDQAFQFCLSCGVLVPEQQKVTPEALQHELARRLSGAMPSQSVIDSSNPPLFSQPVNPADAGTDDPPTPGHIADEHGTDGATS